MIIRDKERNPILRDPAVRDRFAELPRDSQEALVDFLNWLYGYARENANTSWRRQKAPMAVYWSAVKAWAFHLRVAIRRNARASRPVDRRSDNHHNYHNGSGSSEMSPAADNSTVNALSGQVARNPQVSGYKLHTGPDQTAFKDPATVHGPTIACAGANSPIFPAR